MTVHLVCPDGHTWESDDRTSRCPVCGSANTTDPDATRPRAPPAEGPRATVFDGGVPRETVFDVGAVHPSASGTEFAPPGYEVLGELGRGGMGVVYKARQIGLDRLVALKTIRHAAGAGADELDRLRSEARAVARLQHTNIVQVFEVGEHSGLPYFAMELVAGGSLDRTLRDRVYPTRAAAELIATLARAVHAAHEAGVVHRDLKPANVLLATDGTPKVSDFGLARRLDEGSGQTASGAVMGTPSYMAPEQADGRTRHAGPGADIYSLGAILYELLTGRPPFKGETPVETILHVLEQAPVPPSRVRATVEPDLEAVCLKCLEKRPARRYATARELAEDLDRFLAGTATVARPTVPPRGPLARFFRPHRVIWHRISSADVEVLTPLVLVLVWPFIYLGRYLAAADTVPDFASRLVVGLLLIGFGTVVAVWGFSPVIEHRYGRLVPAQRPPRGHAGAVHALAFSPDGRMLATAGEDSTVRLCDADSGAARLALVGHSAAVRGVAFVPDGRAVLTGGEDGTIRRWDPGTGAERAVLWRGPQRVLAMALSADGRLLAAMLGANARTRPRGLLGRWAALLRRPPAGSRLIVLDVAGGRECASIPAVGPGGWGAVALSSDGKTLIGQSGADSGAIVWSLSGLANGEPPAERPVFRGKRFGPLLVFHPDGTIVAAVPSQSFFRRSAPHVALWHTGTGDRLGEVGEAGREFYLAAYSPDGRLLATAAATLSPRVRTLATNQQAAAAGKQAVGVWDAITGRKLAEMTVPSPFRLRALAFSPDGRTLASGKIDGTVQLWEVSAELRKARAGQKG